MILAVFVEMRCKAVLQVQLPRHFVLVTVVSMTQSQILTNGLGWYERESSCITN